MAPRGAPLEISHPESIYTVATSRRNSLPEGRFDDTHQPAFSSTRRRLARFLREDPRFLLLPRRSPCPPTPPGSSQTGAPPTDVPWYFQPCIRVTWTHPSPPSPDVGSRVRWPLETENTQPRLKDPHRELERRGLGPAEKLQRSRRRS